MVVAVTLTSSSFRNTIILQSMMRSGTPTSPTALRDGDVVPISKVDEAMI